MLIDGLGAVPIDEVPDFVNASGFSNNEFEDTNDADIRRDIAVHRELAANALRRNTHYHPLICVAASRLYQVPSNTQSCPDGRAPVTTSVPLDLRAIPITLPPGATQRDVIRRLRELNAAEAQPEGQPRRSAFRGLTPASRQQQDE